VAAAHPHTTAGHAASRAHARTRKDKPSAPHGPNLLDGDIDQNFGP
jgi:hypothetical protein